MAFRFAKEVRFLYGGEIELDGEEIVGKCEIERFRTVRWRILEQIVEIVPLSTDACMPDTIEEGTADSKCQKQSDHVSLRPGRNQEIRRLLSFGLVQTHREGKKTKSSVNSAGTAIKGRRKWEDGRQKERKYCVGKTSGGPEECKTQGRGGEGRDGGFTIEWDPNSQSLGKDTLALV